MSKSKVSHSRVLTYLWIFLSLNYIFCDVFTLMYHEELSMILQGKVGDIEITQEFLLIFAVVMEIPLLMILISRFAGYSINRWLNVGAGVILTIVQAGSLFAGDNTLHYIFFSIIEIGTTLFITLYAFRWRKKSTFSLNIKNRD